MPHAVRFPQEDYPALFTESAPANLKDQSESADAMASVRVFFNAVHSDACFDEVGIDLINSGTV